MNRLMYGSSGLLIVCVVGFLVAMAIGIPIAAAINPPDPWPYVIGFLLSTVFCNIAVAYWRGRWGSDR